MIVSGGDDGTVRVWDAGGGALSTVNIGSGITALAFIDPQTVVVAARLGLLLLQFGDGNKIQI